MANFDLAFNFMGPHEWNLRKNYTNIKGDPGGPTKYGITLGAWRQLGSLADVNHDGVIDEKDIMLLEEPEAKQFYLTRYWIWSGVSDDRLAAKLFDIGVNLGPETATLYLQRALVNLGHIVAIDGHIGRLTLRETNLEDPLRTMVEVAGLQRNHYIEWVNSLPSERMQFKEGLLARAASVPKNAAGASA